MSDDEDESLTPSTSPSNVSTNPSSKTLEAAHEAADNRYTHEQKVVAAVWVHEKLFNGQTWKDIERNFVIRFNTTPPNRSTFLAWERKLFSTGNVEDKAKSGRPLSRLMHVPYVRANLIEKPDLSLRERSRILGLPRTTLLKIMREDLGMKFDIEDEHRSIGGGKWKKVDDTQ